MMDSAIAEKLVLDNIEKAENTLKLYFVSYLKEDFVERAMVLTVNDDTGKLLSIYFSSNTHGTATWSNGMGITNSHRWENEDDIEKVSYLSKHYPALLENGAVSSSYAFDKIIPDVLDNIIETDFTAKISDIINGTEYSGIIDWESVIDEHKKLSEEYIKEQIANYEEKLQRLPREEIKEQEEKIEEPFPEEDTAERGGTLERIKRYYDDIKAGKSRGKEKTPDETDREKIEHLLENARRVSKRIKKIK